MTRESELHDVDLKRDLAIDCGAARFEANGVWITIRDGGKNTLICLAPVNALRLAEKLRRAADEAD